jgi:Trypsin-like peptidase domain
MKYASSHRKAVFAALIAVALMLVIAVSAAAEVFEMPASTRPAEPGPTAPEAIVSPGLSVGTVAAESATLVLDATLVKSAIEQAKRLTDEKRHRLGVSVTTANGSLRWERLTAVDGTQSWRTAIFSPGATFLRVRLAEFGASQDTETLVYGEPKVELAWRLKRPAENGVFWTRTVAGDRLHIEVLTGSDQPPTVRVDRVSHGYKTIGDGEKEAGCYLDPTCYDLWTRSRDGLVHLLFESGGVVFECSGGLLTDVDATFRPLLLTANHCIETDNDADTVEATFFYHTAVCDGNEPNFFNKPKVLGSDLLTTNADIDFSLVELDDDPPEEAVFLGWNRNGVLDGDSVVPIHHPGGSYARISFGKVVDLFSSTIEVRYSESSTEGGSSGCPLFNSDEQVIGSLSAGDAACSFMSGTDYYADFSATWDAGVGDYLTGGGADDDITDDDVSDDDDNDDDDAPLPSGDDDDDDDGETRSSSPSDDSGGCGC